MRFTVVWLPAVEFILESLWLAAPNRQAVTEAVNWLDRELRMNPHAKVTPVDNLYFLRRDPVAILCEIMVDDRVVRVVDIHRTDE